MNYKIKVKYLIPILSVLFLLGVFFTFYKIGMEDRYIQTLSWVVAGKKIVVDPGHGGIFPGKVSTDNTLEKDINLSVAQKLANIIKESGATVIMTRNSDTDLIGNTNGQLIIKQRADLQARVHVAKKNNADIFISIHCNSIPSPKWSGAQTFYKDNDLESELLAKSIQQEIKSHLKNTKREAIIRKDTFLFENLDIPTVIVELGFLSNPQETKLLKNESYQQRLAYAIYSGLVKYLSNSN